MARERPIPSWLAEYMRKSREGLVTDDMGRVLDIEDVAQANGVLPPADVDCENVEAVWHGDHFKYAVFANVGGSRKKRIGFYRDADEARAVALVHRPTNDDSSGDREITLHDDDLYPVPA